MFLHLQYTYQRKLYGVLGQAHLTQNSFTNESSISKFNILFSSRQAIVDSLAMILECRPTRCNYYITQNVKTQHWQSYRIVI